ncbi:hypothetical protein Bca4012_083209 [Brassica carinata]|uniref:DUF7950 domain-containing protein n=1 Tax=Brassica carinata TaxID=52824 RepID=A0A8X8ALB0_BRACI|nr:hypothetical protein Bca52824_027557 [Brassica carinata]
MKADYGKQREASVCDDVADQDKTVVSKIMQRFRPIAPRPAVGESSDDTKSCRFLGRNRRPKRKYVRVRNNNINSGSSNNNKDMICSNKKACGDGENIKTDLDEEIGGEDRSDIVTLQLLPDKDTDHQAGNKHTDPSDMDPRTCLARSSSLDRTVVESWLTVECVNDTCTKLGGYHKLQLSRMNEEEEIVMRMLDADTCPWLVSDGSNRVFWINRAYRNMLGDPDAEVTIKVWLVVATDLMEEMSCMVELYGAVTCKVRVRYDPSTCRNEKSHSESEAKMTVLCDVWRMGSSGFAWRLDVESALTLGR